jgi:hypothetical protein
MAFSLAAVIVPTLVSAISQYFGSKTSADAAKDASETQADLGRQALNLQDLMYQTTRADLSGQRQLGSAASYTLGGMMGFGGVPSSALGEYQMAGRGSTVGNPETMAALQSGLEHLKQTGELPSNMAGQFAAPGTLEGSLGGVPTGYHWDPNKQSWVSDKTGQASTAASLFRMPDGSTWVAKQGEWIPQGAVWIGAAPAGASFGRQPQNTQAAPMSGSPSTTPSAITSSGYVTMVAPTGERREVPEDRVSYYEARGAQRA